MQCPGQTPPVPVQIFSQIRSSVSEVMRPNRRTDKQTAKLISLITMKILIYVHRYVHNSGYLNTKYHMQLFCSKY